MKFTIASCPRNERPRFFSCHSIRSSLQPFRGRPDLMYVVPPKDYFRPEPYRVSDFAAYYRY